MHARATRFFLATPSPRTSDGVVHVPSRLHSHHTYRSEVDRIIRYGGSSKQTSIRRAVVSLIHASARPRDLLLVEELDYDTPPHKTERFP